MKRPCLDCGKITDRGDSRCPACAGRRQRAKDARRGTGRQRYDAAHDRLRAQLLPLVNGKECPRCGQRMWAWQDLDLGHSEARALNPAARADRIEHAHCNRSAGVA